ncbi:hypothetical protein CEXT_481661 [Caerostris extrusa]|uniref:Uncharacterized protein n=1 Tax=Caerostris extrusa TaxID=172846 RepID=A0AAV4VJ10_CAEEX|nr:hypothetical protein CEXT_481661 [Caerostris extrusa]
MVGRENNRWKNVVELPVFHENMQRVDDQVICLVSPGISAVLVQGQDRDGKKDTFIHLPWPCYYHYYYGEEVFAGKKRGFCYVWFGVIWEIGWMVL